MKKIKLLTPILGLTALAGATIPLASCACAEAQIKPELINSSTGVKITDSNIVKGKESTITLEIPSGKVIDTIEVKIGNKVLTKGTDFTIDSNNKITIKASAVDGGNVTVKVIVKDKVTGLSVTYAGEYHKGEAIKASNIIVKPIIGLKTIDTPLVWGTEYSIAKEGGTAIANFDTVGYTFTEADETAGHVDFKVTYLADTSITGDVNVLVTPSATTIQLDNLKLTSPIIITNSKEQSFKAENKYIVKIDFSKFTTITDFTVMRTIACLNESGTPFTKLNSEYISISKFTVDGDDKTTSLSFGAGPEVGLILIDDTCSASFKSTTTIEFSFDVLKDLKWDDGSDVKIISIVGM